MTPARPFDLPAIAAGLAAAPLIDELPARLAGVRAAVVQAPPGSGKTTVVPPILADLPTGRPGRVVVTQPRRIAARAAARRLAELTGTRVGDLAGYSVRGERAVGPHTRVEFVTDGLFLRRLLAEPDLPGVAAVVVDEVHERSLAGDLGFGMLREVALLRDDLHVVAMSATLDAARWAVLLGAVGADDATPAPVVEIRAQPHPLEVVWAPPPPRVRALDARGVTPDFLAHVARTTATAARTQDGDALVFVPGVREIERVAAALAGLAPTGPDGRAHQVLPLHGRLPRAAQDAALTPGVGRRIIVATDVAETSLTVPGVGLVVDAGLARQPRPDPARGTAALVTVSVSRAAATQRAGRAARLGPGTVVRCYREAAWAGMAEEAAPQIATSDLTEAMLLLACWGAPGGHGLTLPQPPPPAAAAAATATLLELGAVTDDGSVTPLGRVLAKVPADPRLARALLEATDRAGRGQSRRVAEAVAVVNADERAPGGDLATLWRRLRAERGPAGTRWREDTARFHEAARTARPREVTGRAGGATGEPAIDDDALLGLVVALAHPRRLARRRPDEPGRYLLASGTGARLPTDSPLAGQDWLAVADLGPAGTGGTAATGNSALVRAAVPVSREHAEAAGSHLLTRTRDAVWTGQRITGRERTSLGAVLLGERPATADPEQARALAAELLAGRGLGLFALPDSFTTLRARLGVLHQALGDPWPDVTTATLTGGAGERRGEGPTWLGPELGQLAAGRDPARIPLTPALQRLLPWPQAGRLDHLAPERLEVPSGSRIRLAYPDPDGPAGRVVLAVKLQECFGLTRAPRIADGRVGVQVHLLSPARRPLAVTEDLASFWREVYPQVRAENRGRYPRHPWPDDPLTAPARAGTTRSGR